MTDGNSAAPAGHRILGTHQFWLDVARRRPYRCNDDTRCPVASYRGGAVAELAAWGRVSVGKP